MTLEDQRYSKSREPPLVTRIAKSAVRNLRGGTLESRLQLGKAAGDELRKKNTDTLSPLPEKDGEEKRGARKK